MRKFKFDKLVRDDIATNIETNSGRVVKRTLSDDEFIEQLHAKLLEEFTEYTKASPEDVASELSDVYEVLDTLRDALKISESQLQEARVNKAQKNGAFKNRIFIDYVEVKEDYPWIKYYEKNPDRYPEIK